MGLCMRVDGIML